MKIHFNPLFPPLKTILLAFLVAPWSARANSQPLVYLKPAAAEMSSFDETPNWAPPKDPRTVIDGSLQTRWASKSGEDPQWVVLDLGTEKTVDQLTVHWERAYATVYKVEVSKDKLKWNQVFMQKKGEGGTETIQFKPVVARYVRLISLQRLNNVWGVSIWEIEPYGPRDKNPGDRPLAEVYPMRKTMQTRGITIKEEKPLPSPGPIDPNALQTGINYTSWHEAELGLPDSDATLRHLQQKNVRHIALLTTWFQKDPKSIEIRPQSPKGGQTPTDEALGHTINVAHSLGMRVMLKPHVDVDDGTYRGEVYPPDAWFESYEKFILHYARLAQKYNCEMFAVGTELKGATTWEQGKRWRRLIGKIRSVYKGPLTYAANWDEYDTIGFWDDLDYIGIDAYFPLTNKFNPTLKDLIAGWEESAGKIEDWRSRQNLDKPVLFTEIGYPSVDGAGMQPWIGLTNVKDRQEQADCIEAAFQVLTKKPWFRGFYWWHYFPVDKPLTEDLTLKGKLAEDVFSTWYKKINQGGLPQ